MDSDKKEKEFIFEWACRNESEELEKSIFSSFMQDADSYFIKREQEDNYLHEYKFQTLPELRAALEKMWEGETHMDAVLKPVLVGAFKKKVVLKEENTDSEFDDIQKKEKLSPYIYNF